MLTRLELIGFKSFADRTRLDFAPGITAVVGPNGSGKSNIVDAVRWVLGEQSAKALRGGDMADVIFNGSASRKSLGMAEVTLTFDNAAKILNHAADEVQVTRRVYRDGQGEYLINGQEARLKDLREVFLGSGAAGGAYAIIEQGRVDALLTASNKDRRLIFEEAAGISRFKAKKADALRKLERVDADLNRVRDVLGELEKNLRTLSSQSAKAQKHQEYHARLKALRVGQAAREYAHLALALGSEESALASFRDELATVGHRAAAAEADAKKLDWDLARTEDALRHHEKHRAEAQQQIAAQDAAAKFEREQLIALEAELLRVGGQRADLGYRTRTLEADAATARARAVEVSALVQARAAHAETASHELKFTSDRIAGLSKQIDTDRAALFEWVSRAAQQHTGADSHRTQADRAERELARRKSEAGRADAEAAALATMLDDLARNDADLQGRLGAARQSIGERERTQRELRRKADALQPSLDAKRDERSDLRGRAEVLEGLEKSREGFGAGVRELMAALDAGSPLAPWVVGLVADLLTVPREFAALVDVALGDFAQAFVLREAARLDPLLASVGPVAGRIGFVPLRAPATEANAESLAQFVACEAFPTLPARLLGNVLLADTLAAARSRQVIFPGLRIVTRAGELLEPDGTLSIGPPRTEAGLLSRKSELRELRARGTQLDAELVALEASQADYRRQAAAHEAPLAALAAEVATLTGEAGNLRERIVRQREKFSQLSDTSALLASEMEVLASDLRRLESLHAAAAASAAEADQRSTNIRNALAAAEAGLRTATTDRDARQLEQTAAQVALSEARQQAAGWQTRVESLDAELRQRRIDALNAAAAERTVRAKQTASLLAALRATARSADAYARKDERERKAAEASTAKQTLAAEREYLRERLRTDRDSRQRTQDQAHAHELAARDFRNKLDALAARIRDDYQLNLAEVAAGEGADDLQEIEEVRQKLARLGSVNLEALEQLATEEARERDYRAQYDDLNGAEKSLLEIIEQINADSRRLFLATLAAAKGHFQELFRKLFGGGMADIILEDPTDVLESGIEITARPPGKEPRSIALLSGGEKTLTAVALLLALFRSKPSPFCLLDEVDAALDEANAVRLAGLLQEFAQTAQFIVITHRKRTMAVAHTLHGITMQESGISKRIALRFDDWTEDAAKAA